MYTFATLDPRTIPAATEANDKVFIHPVYGVEVTVPALAARCVNNIDPQHSGGDVDQAAIEVALTCELPPEGATLATVRADLDSIGAMAVLRLRAQEEWDKIGDPEAAYQAGLQNMPPIQATPEEQVAYQQGAQNMPYQSPHNRVAIVADADKFVRGGYPGPRSLPTRDKPWPTGGSAEATRELAAIAAAVADFKIPLADRVATMERWLLTGEEPEAYRTQVEKERQSLIDALEIGEIKAEVRNGIAVVETTHRAATLIGYCLAPVVVALNPEFRFRGGEPHRKFTVCQYKPGHVDLKAALADLSQHEVGWGGSPTIVGSKQGQGSKLSLELVINAIAHHLK